LDIETERAGGPDVGASPGSIDERATGRNRLSILSKVASFVLALFLFVLAIQLMKDGAKAIAPAIQGSPLFSNAFSTLGAGWLGAYVVLSGSPIAAVSLGLFAGGAISQLQTFTMLSGSRFGASFIVLLVGFLYAVRNRSRSRGESVGMGILALSLTALAYVPGMLIGYTLLKTGSLDLIRWSASKDALSLIDVIWGPTLRMLQNTLPGWSLLPAGLAIILVSFKFLDRVLPEVDGERATSGRAAWLRRKWPMFLLGCIVATLTLSVSVALTVLVPLASRGYVKRDEAMPYIMGANITTLADTLVAAMLTGNHAAVHIVLAEAIGVSVVTIVYLALFYDGLKRMVLGLDDWLVASNRRLLTFVAAIFVLPVFFLLSGAVIGPIAR
jgi:solute carrier family 34 (sodium-dependent phosphate cotransporter)